MAADTACDSKRTYRTEAAARDVLRKMKRRVVDPFRLRAYYCKEHRGWHVGNTPFAVKPGAFGG